MKPSEYMDLINDYEARFPVEQWAVRGVRVWPIIRVALSRELHLTGTPDRVRDFSENSASEAKAALRGIIGHFRAQLVDFRHNQWPVGHRGAVFLTNAHFRVPLNGQWYDQTCDPVIEALGRKGVGSFVLERNLRWDYRIPRYSGSKFVLPRLKLMRLQTKLLRPRLAADQVTLPEFDRFLAELAGGGYGINLPTRDKLETLVDALLRSAAYFRRILRQLGAFLGFTVAYYGLDGMAFNLACRQVGLASVDIQHGLQGPLHVAYGRWLKVPERGWELLPRIFWSWSDLEAENIRAWNGAAASWHSPVVGGNPWLEMWQRGQSRPVRICEQALAGLGAAPQAGRRVLVALGPFREMLAPWIIEAIRTAPPTWVWWLRLHPQWRTLAWARKLLLDHFGPDRPANIEIDQATAAPLPALLRFADAVVTGYSSVVLEAEALGVPAILTDPLAAEFYADQIKAGSARLALGTGDLIEAVKAAPALRRKPESSGPEPGLSLDRGLEELLRLAGEAGSASGRRSRGRGPVEPRSG